MPCPTAGCGSQNAPFVQFTDIIVKAVVLTGLYDVEKQQDVLGTTGLPDKSLADTITLIQDKEVAARSVSHPGTWAGALTTYGRLKGLPRTQLTDKRLIKIYCLVTKSISNVTKLIENSPNTLPKLLVPFLAIFFSSGAC